MLALSDHRLHEMVIKLIETPLFRAVRSPISHHALCTVWLKTACGNLTLLAFLGDFLIKLFKLMTLHGSLVEGTSVERDDRVKLVVRAIIVSLIAKVIVRLLGLNYQIRLEA